MGSGKTEPDIVRFRLAKMVAVGAVTSSSVRIWCCSDGESRCRIEVRAESGTGRPPKTAELELSAEADHTGSVRIDGLEPLTEYHFEAFAGSDEESLGSGRFRTAPDESDACQEPIAFAIASCHLPFATDGHFSKHSREMLEATRRCFEEHDIRFAIFNGDQLYADQPAGWSLYDETYLRDVLKAGSSDLRDLSSDEIRKIFQERYRTFWAQEPWQRIHAMMPCYTIWDDHEIIDNWGSDESHTEPGWQRVFQGAREAFFDYQGARQLDRTNPIPEDFDLGFDFGDLSFYLLDLRSQRRVGDDPQICSNQQFENLKAFLQDRGDRSAVFLVLSVPLIHVPRSIARFGARVTPDGEDFSDRWSTRGHESDRQKMLQLLRDQLRAFPKRRLVLLSGDIHVGSAHELEWDGDTPSALQFVSSALTNRAAFLARALSALAVSVPLHLTVNGEERVHCRLLPKDEGKNPYLGLNVGIVETRRRAEGGREVRFLLYGHKGEEPKLAYRSPWL
ncbi:MAG: alkaline phosphatase D family protein [Planctomycetota bacterium]